MKKIYETIIIFICFLKKIENFNFYNYDQTELNFDTRKKKYLIQLERNKEIINKIFFLK